MERDGHPRHHVQTHTRLLVCVVCCIENVIIQSCSTARDRGGGGGGGGGGAWGVRVWVCGCGQGGWRARWCWCDV